LPDTGAGSSAFPLLRYNFEYFQNGAESGTLTKVRLYNKNVTYTTPEVTLGEIFKGRLKAVNDADESVWTEYVEARALLLPDAPGKVDAVNDGVY